ncbi:MAG TPA: hypothetical protein V6D14_30030 [Coleofasciculaceae cyanobacterium]|jgi:hypothetical protein
MVKAYPKIVQKYYNREVGFDRRLTSEPLEIQGFSSMTKHYILSINPNAQYEWEQCILRDPLTAERPDFASLIAQAVGEEAGSYLVAINIEVKVLEKASISQPQKVPVEVVAVAVNPPPSELVA